MGGVGDEKGSMEEDEEDEKEWEADEKEWDGAMKEEMYKYGRRSEASDQKMKLREESCREERTTSEE